MADLFNYPDSSKSAPATRHFEITPSDTVDLAVRPRALRCGTSGTVTIRDENDVDVTYPVSAGEVLPIRAVRVLATGTTASVVGWY